MIKLIATDLDGSLLDSQKRIPSRLDALLDALTERGVLFAMATGRNARTMRDLFRDYLDRVVMITDNGTTILYRGEVIDRCVITKQVLSLTKDDPDLHPLGCGEKHMYYLQNDSHAEFNRLIHLFFTNHLAVTSMEAAYDADCFNRFGFYDEQNPETHGVEVLAPLRPDLLAVPSGDGWIDVYHKDWGKGACLKRLQQRFGITPEETMCFGDYLNDLDMMPHCAYSYAMKNAHPGLKAVCHYETRFTNDEDGVVNAIVEALGITDV